VGASGGGAAAAAEAEALRAMPPEELHEALLAARAEAAEERAERADMKDRLLRTLADMENLRERTARQAAEARQFAVQNLVEQLCDVADNLERAAGAVPADALAADPAAAASLDAAAPALARALGLLRGLREGVALTDSILMGVLAREGVERYDPLGAEFDPNLHNALFEVPDPARAPGTVAAVIKKGYTLHGRAVRAADVGVARAP
jgi:molecular chaperone GrpE